MAKHFPVIFSAVFLSHLLIILGWGLNFSSESSIDSTHSAFKVKIGVPEIKQVRSVPPPRPVEANKPSKTQEQPQAEAVDEPVSLAPSSEGVGSQVRMDIRSVYQAELRARVESNKTYPLISRRLGQTGLVVIGFTLLQDGSIINPRVLTSSRFERLDESALKAVIKVRKFKPIPKELGESQMDLKVPIEFLEI